MSFMELKEELIRTFMVKVDAINDEVVLRDMLNKLRATPSVTPEGEKGNKADIDNTSTDTPYSPQN